MYSVYQLIIDIGLPMVLKSGSKNKYEGIRSGNAGDRDRTIAELKDRVAFLENELQLKKDNGTIRGIAERKGIEQELMLTQFSVEKASDEIFWMDSSGRVIYVNDAACHMLGHSRDELLGMCVWDFDPTYSPEIWLASFTELKKQGFLTFETMHKARGGRVFPVEISANYVEYGGKAYSFSFVRDITERRRVEEALWESERKFRAIFDQTLQFIGLLAIDGTLLEANRAALEFIGARESDVVGKPFWDAPWWTHSPALQARLRRAVKAAAKGETVRFEATLIAKGHSLFHIDFSLKPLIDEDGNVILLIPEGRDITERKRAEGALRKSEAQLAKSQEMAHIGSWEQDVATGRIERSAESYQIYGVTPGESDINYRDFIDFIVPEDRERVNNAVKTTIETGQPYTVRYNIRRKGGEIRTLLSHGEAAYDESGRIVKLYGSNQDITEFKRVEDALEGAKAQAELYLDLMGHDINNYNQVALGYLELLNDLVCDPALKELAAKPVEAIASSSRLIENVRKLQKASTGQLKTQAVDLDKVLSDLQAQYSEVPGKAAVIQYSRGTDCIVTADGLIKDVFANLVGNAIKHSNGDSPAEVTIRLTKNDDNGRKYCRVSVEDNGPGIPDAVKDKLFHRFQRGETQAHGKGLGLYLVRSLVEGYGGRVWVEDRVKGDHTQGARFVVMLPAIKMG